MDFVTVDFETANSSRSSACSIGIVEVSQGKIVFEQEWLINPDQHFDPMNISIHNITPAMVKDQPTFQELWPTLLPFFENKSIVAHNASFDMSVLRYCLDHALLHYPAFEYYCTYLLSKKILTHLPSHKLNVISNHYGITFNHHDALEDARATANVLLKLLEQEQHHSPAELAKAYGYQIGQMYAGGYTSFSGSTVKKKKSKATPANTKSNVSTTAPTVDNTSESLLIDVSTLKHDSTVLPIPTSESIIHNNLISTTTNESVAGLMAGQKIAISSKLSSSQFLIEIDWNLDHVNIDLDATAFLLYANEQCKSDSDCIFYGQPDTATGSVSYSKLRTNKAQFKVNLAKLSFDVQKIAFALTIYQEDEQQYHFSEVSEIHIRLIDPIIGKELAHFEVGQDLTKETAIVIGEMYLHKSDWKFNPIGKGFFGGLQALCEGFGLEVNEVNR